LHPTLSPRPCAKWTEGRRTIFFGPYRIDEAADEGARPQGCGLPSGGYLVIDPHRGDDRDRRSTPGKFIRAKGGKPPKRDGHEETNLESRGRRIVCATPGCATSAGIIVIDFVDHVLEFQPGLVLRRLVECLGPRTRTRHQVAEITSLGLVQMNPLSGSARGCSRRSA